MFGERIRKIRKQKKMTLETLAGKELTKGMLSLIENNKSNPSMESLAYIAERLEVEVADLLEEVSTQELREILEKAEKLYNADYDTCESKYKDSINLIEPYLGNLTQGYESARLLEIYSRSLYHEKQDRWQEFSERAAGMYDQLNLSSNRANIGIFHAMDKFVKHEYAQALELLLSERANLESNHDYIDAMTRVDLDYHEAILYFAVGDSDSATRVMESAINYSKKHRIFYLIDDLYRMATFQAMMSHHDEKKEYYLKKLKQYGEFAEEIDAIMFHDFVIVESLIFEKQDYVNALNIIDQYISKASKMEKDFETRLNLEPWIDLEKGKALFGIGQFDEAIHWIEKVTIPSMLHHPFDLSFFYVGDSYKALCLLELGNVDKALHSAKKAVRNFDPLPHTPYKDFSTETYQTIKTKLAEDC